MTLVERQEIVLHVLEMAKDQMHRALDGDPDIKLSEFIKVYAQNCRNITIMMQKMHQDAITEEAKIDKP